MFQSALPVSLTRLRLVDGAAPVAGRDLRARAGELVGVFGGRGRAEVGGVGGRQGEREQAEAEEAGKQVHGRSLGVVKPPEIGGMQALTT
ncbi:hypothetical protein LRS03_17070 [Rhizobacter sp. J219]|uniref:hypothetical protein n=1 Tax=Rhizobacter sp. J219 TaxID=2898430 RepID=UPI0021518250|nr:hypothetical protein [Rhizobacter sp. J219]MCR5884466.1 hypothetical protein [Rhizobacter sp. J219]